MSLIEKATSTATAPKEQRSGSGGPSFLYSFLPATAGIADASLPQPPWMPWPRRLPLQNPLSIARARFPIYRAKEMLIGMPVLCEGWAARVCWLADGRRQIISFVLPGDLMSTNVLFTPRLSFYIEAITEVYHSHYDRPYFEGRLAHDRELVRALGGACLCESEEVEQLAAILGRCRAEERIARLFLRLMGQMEMRGLVHEQSFSFPLRQQHIADATGLTVVHANRVIGAFRIDGLIELASGILRIKDLARLQRIAG